MNEYQCDKANDEAAEYEFIMTEEARSKKENGLEAIAMWHESANIPDIKYTPERPTFR